MAPVQQDAFMDDSDESCPLCVEEFDLSDKNFRPCPCGYQVCQFCYNNIKNNMNGLCPACRRPYDDQSIEWKIVSPEEQKADIALQARKKALARKKESEQRQVETLNRKHLAGLRVVQKNLVYVVGLSQKSSEEEFLQTLRGDQYFGQYGKIVKIVVSKAKEGSSSNSIGVYVTFEQKEDAAKCIAAVDHSRNLDRPLRAQYGTTKYCSAYLRNEQCQNRNCTFLHETGEDFDSFSRQDLSSMNAMSTQRPAQQPASSRSTQQPPPPQPPPQQAPQSISAATQPASHLVNRDDAMSRSDSGDGSALPSSASWAAKNAESRRSSKPASVSAPSPVVTDSKLHTQAEEHREAPSEPSQQMLPTAKPTRPPRPPSPFLLEQAIKNVLESDFKFVFDRSMYSAEDLQVIDNWPPLFSDDGGLIRYRIAKEQEQERLEQEERNVIGAMSAAEEEKAPASGSLQLGGEPETQDEPNDNAGPISVQQRGTIQPPYATPSSANFPFGASVFQSNTSNLPRSLTPQQQQQLSLLQRGNSTRMSPISQFPPSYSQTTSLHQHQQSNPFQMQIQTPSFSSSQGHARQASRYTFANDSASASTAVKPGANPQLMAQQAAMMPNTQTKQYQNQQYQQSNTPGYFSGVQGPPPGLKSSGTPPINGSGMFGQGHGFASAMGGSAGFGGNVGSKNSNDELVRELLRTRNGSASGQGSDIGKREFKFPFSQQSMTSDAPASSFLSSRYGSQLGAHQGFQDHNLQKQKKKGKKHRHANTSSSGGGGIVDLADPSILQARMHHGGGQGQYAAQGQEVLNPPSFPGAASKVDSLVRDAVVDVPTQPSSSKAVPRSTSTPTPVPPGLTSAQDFPSLPAPSVPPLMPPVAPRVQRKATAKTTTAAIKPVVPVVPPSGPKATVALDPQKKTQRPQLGLSSSTLPNVESEPSTKVDVVESLKSNSEAKQPVSAETLATDLKATTSKSIDKRQRLSKIDIGAAKESSKRTDSNIISTEASRPKDKETSSAILSGRPVSQPATPGTAASQASLMSFAKPNQPRTLRVIPTNEIPPRPNTNSPGLPGSPFASQRASRKPSITSINRPGTPASVGISDNASYTSTSMSRANSPPPSRVGTAPVRHLTKAQQKKERQVRARQAEEASKVEEPPSKVEEPVQGPILGRKKKTKKPNTGTADSTPAVTRPTSPEAGEDRRIDAPPPMPGKEYKKGTAKAIGESKKQEEAAKPLPNDPPQPQKSNLTPSALYSALLAANVISTTTADLFKPVSSSPQRADNLNLTDISTQPLPPLTPFDIRTLDAGTAIILNYGPTFNLRAVVLPDRRVLRGFSPHQAQRYLDLQKRLGSVPANPALDALMPRLQPAAPSVEDDSIKDETELVNRFAAQSLDSGLANNETGGGVTSTGATGSGITAGAVGGKASGNNGQSGQNAGAVVAQTLNVEEAEQALASNRRETEQIEKRLNALIKKNRRVLLGGAH